jgi:LPXTG-motif cell wall-anchored protein
VTPARLIVLLLAALALCAPAATFAQTPTVPQDGAGLGEAPPVDLGGGQGDPAGGDEPPEGSGADDPAPAEGAETRPGELPNTGSEPGLLFLTGAALSLIGLGLRLRTADADLY